MVLSILYFLYGKSWMRVLLLDPKDKRITWHFFFHENLGTANLISEWPRSIRSFSLTHVNVDTTALLSAHRDHHKFFAYRIAIPLQHFHIYFSAEVLGTANISPMHRDTTSHGITRGVDCRSHSTAHFLKRLAQCSRHFLGMSHYIFKSRDHYLLLRINVTPQQHITRVPQWKGDATTLVFFPSHFPPAMRTSSHLSWS